jgi:hypothetical protein
VSAVKTKVMARVGVGLVAFCAAALPAVAAPLPALAADPVTLTTPDPGGGSGHLDAVSCATDTTCVAVGHSRSGALIERYNGRGWTVQRSAVPAGVKAASVSLESVACATARACTAVGFGTDHKLVALVERFDGTRWRAQTLARGRSGGTAGAAAIACPTARACLATADATAPGVIERWDGRRWLVSATLPAGTHLLAISCGAADRCLAVGVNGDYDAVVERFDGRRWHAVRAPSSAVLTGVSCPSVTFCLLAGTTTDGDAPDGVVARWDGTRLATVSPFTPQPGAFALSAVSCASAAQCLVLGGFGAADPTEQYGATWDGTGLRSGFTVTGQQQFPWNGVSCRPSFCLLVGKSAGRPASARYAAVAAPAA